MSSCLGRFLNGKIQLRIPMRGYEGSRPSTKSVGVICYESPCGVMRRINVTLNDEVYELRIPMRGYELAPWKGDEPP